MSNESPERRDREVATSTFEEWVAQKASERDSSREHVLEQLLDSYWTLEQITQVLGEKKHTPQTGEQGTNDHWDAGERHRGVTVTESERNEVLDTVEALQTELEAASRRRAELFESVQSLADRLEEVEATQGSVDELAETVEAVRSTLETEQDRLHDRMDDEFDHLQTILDYLVRGGDERDTRISDMQTQYRAEIRQLRAEHDKLRRIKEEARDLGTYIADCEQCGESLDFALLTTPNCPNCDRQLTGVNKETNWFVFTSYTATTRTGATASPSPKVQSGSSLDERPTTHRDDETEPVATANEEKEEEEKDEQSASNEVRPDETDRQTDTGESSGESGQPTPQDGDESAGTSPDETEFQWLT
ncbi:MULTISPECIES: hypothetical protein [Haloferax]|uniref:CopG family transcriptional regulator n=1 Tax=Haloferax marinum TaxID=2666143 RepID=A0A6A8G9F8_9EURY|nr:MULTISPECIES: hypothetical protein [Haloferax]KAB1198158.1 hypothetical protein Hfx1150_11770 [Haloferax sp. CBA1150]MRW97238.1 hypothetical protein [Haloferax marinum]